MRLLLFFSLTMVELPPTSILGKASRCVHAFLSTMYASLEPLSFLVERWILEEDLSNFQEVTPHLYRGGQPLGDGYKDLEERGLRTIINLRAIDTGSTHGTSLHYIHIPIQPHKPQKEDLIAFLKIIQDSRHHPIYVHCFHGADRTGLFIAVYRIVCEGWSKEEALQEMVHGGFGFHTLFQQNLIYFLEELDIDEIVRALDN